MLTTDTLFVGVTRPTMVAGVTLPAFLLNTMLSSIVFLAANNILYLSVCIPIHAVAYLVCLNEPRAFELLFLWAATKGRNLNRRLWRSSSYSPLEPFRAKARARAGDQP
ncbi:type IV secretion system protein VirB3 [Massilia soli]|uniref:Type IV secretion system protein VirB3 n=1 Tax=Massilia soli TaxID=2792854 RepID=A0ABS7SMQ0_9BURK|nr:type IV secretion system protein VirB3 [Massilia soli]MBZ2207151.1 type IV secretion system protein VirB3 [Massilia soli]